MTSMDLRSRPSVLLFLVTVTMGFSQIVVDADVVLNIKDDHVVEMRIAGKPYKRIVEVYNITNVGGSNNAKPKSTYSISMCQDSVNSTWIARPGRYLVVVQRIFNGAKVELNRAEFRI